MASQVPPKRGAAFAFDVNLVSQADPDIFQTTVTLAAGDIQVSKDGAQYANLATFPPAERDFAGGADSGTLRVQLTAAEMTADTVAVLFHDQADDEWQDLLVTIHTVTTSQIDDLATAADLAAVATAVDLNTSIISPAGGTTDGDGTVGGTTVLDSTRAEATGHWNNLTVEITSGICEGQSRTIKTYTNGVGFTFVQPFTAQIVSGVTYRIISAVVYQPGIVITKNHPTAVEPDTLSLMGVAIITNAGQPEIAELTVGVITINRIRAGVSTAIVSAAACVAADGNIFYSHTFPSASWQAGDLYQAIMTGQQVAVNGITYDLSMIILDGRISREAEIDTNVDSILDDTGTNGVVVAAASKTGYALSAAGVDGILDEAVEGTYTMRQLLRLMASAIGGEAIGGGTTTITFRDINDTKDRIEATVDANGNRSTVTLDLT